MSKNNQSPVVQDPTVDLMDQLVEEWRRERPDFDPGAMAVVGRVMRLGKVFELQAEAALKPFGVRYTDFDILATLRRSGAPYRLPPSRLCESVVLSSGAMTTALDRLERMSLISRLPDPGDRRIKAAQLTPQGIETAERAAEARFAAARDGIASLSKKDADVLAKYLKALGE